MIKHQMFIAAALLAGVAIGYFVKDEPVPVEEQTFEVAVKKPVADKGEGASVKALRHRIAELERMLAEKDGKSEIAISNAVAEAAKARPPERPRQSWRERMEEMKKNDPKHYTEMTNNIANWRRSRAELARSKMDFLSSVDVSRMGADAKKTHGELLELIARRQELEEQMHREDLTDEERGKLRHDLWTSQEELMRLNDLERGNLFEETARNLGFSGDDAKEISTTIMEVIEATDGGWGPSRHRGGPRGR